VSQDKSKSSHEPTLVTLRYRRALEDRDADRTCRSCGNGLVEMNRPVETSEMIDVVEVPYRVVQVEQQTTCVRVAAASRSRQVPFARDAGKSVLVGTRGQDHAATTSSKRTRR
jgi:hypothetical protein